MTHEQRRDLEWFLRQPAEILTEPNKDALKALLDAYDKLAGIVRHVGNLDSVFACPACGQPTDLIGDGGTCYAAAEQWVKENAE